jgi:glutaredoxin 3
MAKVVVYSMLSCPYCVKAKSLLKDRGISFEEVVVDYDDEAMWDELYRKSGMKTVPQIYVDGKCLGGQDDLAKLDAEDGLQSLKS